MRSSYTNSLTLAATDGCLVHLLKFYPRAWLNKFSNLGLPSGALSLINIFWGHTKAIFSAIERSARWSSGAHGRADRQASRVWEFSLCCATITVILPLLGSSKPIKRSTVVLLPWYTIKPTRSLFFRNLWVQNHWPNFHRQSKLLQIESSSGDQSRMSLHKHFWEEVSRLLTTASTALLWL